MIIAGCKAEASDAPLPTLLASATAPNAAPVALARPPSTPEPARGGGALELAGELRPDQAAELAFRVAGQLLTVKVERGARVKKGQLLAALVDAEARAQLARAEAAVVQAKAAVWQMGAQLALARDEESRAAALLSAHAAPGSQAVAVKLRAESAEAAEQGAKAALWQAQAQRDLAAAVLASHQLRAPFGGVIVRVPDGVGGIVAPGTVLFRLESLDRLVLRSTISEAELERPRVGDTVLIDAARGRKVTGNVKLVLRSLEAQSRRAPIEVSVPNRERALVAGGYVRATVKAH